MTFALSRVSNIGDDHPDHRLHIEQMTPAGPRRRCHPHFAGAGSFATGVSDALIKLHDPQLRGPAAHWEGVCLECRKTLGIADLLRARQAHIESSRCRHGVRRGDRCEPCDVLLRKYDELRHEDTPLEGWQVLPFGPPQMIRAGQELTLWAQPQRMMRGPYRLRLHVEPAAAGWLGSGHLKDQIYIRDIKVGQCTLFYAWGEVWGWAFEDVDASRPIFDRLLPLGGPCLNLGNHLQVSVRNGNNISAQVSIVLFGHGMEERSDPERAHDHSLLSGHGRRFGESHDPGRPPPLPGHVSVRPSRALPAWAAHAIGAPEGAAMLGDLNPFAPGDWDAVFSSIDEQIIGPATQRVVDEELARAYKSKVSYAKLPEKLPALRPALLDLGGELFLLELKPGSDVYTPQGRLLDPLVSLLAGLDRLVAFDGSPPASELFVAPRFSVAGVEYEVRRYEPPAPPPPPPAPPLSAADLAALAGHHNDREATAAYLEKRAHLLDDDEGTAWESPHDEWP